MREQSIVKRRFKSRESINLNGVHAMSEELDHVNRLNLHLSDPDLFDGPNLDDLEMLRDEIERLRFFAREVVRQEEETPIPSFVITAARIALAK